MTRTANPTAILPAYKALSNLFFGGNMQEDHSRASNVNSITLTEDIVVNGNQYLPEGTTIIIKKPTR